MPNKRARPQCDPSSAWNSFITSSVNEGESRAALAFYDKIPKGACLPIAASTYIALLKACARLKDAVTGHRIHVEVSRKGLLEDHAFVGSTMVDMYAKCGSLTVAEEVFADLPSQNVASWTALIAAYAESGHPEMAICYLEEMRHHGVCTDQVTLVCALKACSSINSVKEGKELHNEIVKKGFEGHLVVASSLVDMYAKCGFVTEAEETFDRLPAQDTVSWTALIGGYAEHGLGQEALRCVERMQDNGSSPDAGTFVCCLKACGNIKAPGKGRMLHVRITREGLDKDIYVGSSLVDMYSKCGYLAEAQSVFDRLPYHNVVLWTALITGYSELGLGEEALFYMKQMEKEGISPVSPTFISGLKSCGSVGATLLGTEMHAEIVSKEFEKETLVSNTLVDMYAKCGSLREALDVFDRISDRTVISWTALITGYAQIGDTEGVFQIFSRMIREGIKPTFVTIGNILNACNHTGLLEEGLQCFAYLSREYGMVPTLEHFTCIVDLVGRAGHTDTAIAMLRKMPFHPGTSLWHCLLGACRKWGHVELGRHAFEQAMGLDNADVTAYIGMLNIYAGVSLQDDAAAEELLPIVEMQAGKRMR